MPLPLSLTNVHNPQPGWYRGDFHCHTNHSDGVHPPPELAAVAQREGLDFFFITDHNAVGAYGEFGPTPLLILPGVEATYKRGHWNIFGITENGDWLQQICSGYIDAPRPEDPYPTVNTIMKHTASLGLLNSINHPLLTPWAWEFPDTELQYLHALEIWNDPSWPSNDQANPSAVELWTRMLNDGWRITALGGSDYHRPHPPAGHNKPDERLGLPSTYVYVENLSGAAILAAVRAQRAYVSAGPRLTLAAHFNGAQYAIGAEIGDVSGPVEFNATVADGPPSARMILVQNGQTLAEVSEPQLHVRVGANHGQAAWYRCEVREANEKLLAITNPIFVGPHPTPTKKTFGEFLA